MGLKQTRTVILLALTMFALGCDLPFSLTGASPTATTAPTARAQAATATPRTLPGSTSVPASPTAALQASPATGGGGIITNAVTARDSSAILNTPIGITDTFPPKHPKIHIIVAVSNASSGSIVKAAMTAVDVGSAAPPNTKLGEPTLGVSGSQNADFFFEPTAQGFPIGTYKVDVYLNNKLDRTLNFSVKEGTPISTPIPTKAVGSCPPPPAPNYKPPFIATKVAMAEDVKGSELEPVNITRVFKTSSVFHAVVTLTNAPANTKIKAVWYGQDLGNAEPCNSRLTEYEVTASGSHNVEFNYRPPSKWPIGIYRVEINVNDNLNIDIDFRVQ